MILTEYLLFFSELLSVAKLCLQLSKYSSYMNVKWYFGTNELAHKSNNKDKDEFYCDFFAELDNRFWIFWNISLILCCLQFNSYRNESLLHLICIINIFSITFLSLQNQQDNKASSISKLKCYKSCSIWQLPRNKYLSDFKLPVWHNWIEGWKNLHSNTPFDISHRNTIDINSLESIDNS